MRLAVMLIMLATPALSETQDERNTALACMGWKLSILQAAPAITDAISLSALLDQSGDKDGAEVAAGIASRLKKSLDMTKKLSDGVCE